MLSESESDTENLHRLVINEHYAKAFSHRKEREELQKLKDKYGSDIEESDVNTETDSEEADSEDELGEELTPAVDAAILRTLARIKRKDPTIYNQEADVFQEEQGKTGSLQLTRPLKDKSKPVTIRQVRLEATLNPSSRSPSPRPVTHADEQRALRDETIAIFHSAVDPAVDAESGDDSDNLLVPREKSKDELEREDEEYRAFLQREVGDELPSLITVEKGMVSLTDVEGPKKTKRKREKGTENRTAEQETDQEFLMNYVLNRGWIDRSAQRVPTYKEATSTRKKRKSKGDLSINGHLDSEEFENDSQNENINSEDEFSEDDNSFDELAETFESSYNFRFEEPDAAVIKSYPRNLPSLARREDTTRKDARERRKKRKEEEIQQKKEEVRRLKGLKMKALAAKLERIGREGGKIMEESKALQDLDLEGDWDPEAHDRQMANIYDDDDDGIHDEDKPHWDDDIDIADIVPADENTSTKAKKKKKKKKKDTDQEVKEDGVDVDVMDAEAEPQDDEEWDGTEEMRKRKLNEYMDEIYGLEFNDIVGDIPTRFKYIPVPPQSYALTPAEILMATDTELNQYYSVKKYAPYRKDTRWDATRNDRLKELKRKIVEREGDAVVDGTGEEARPTKKRKGKKERQKMKAKAQEAQEKEGASSCKMEGSDKGKETRDCADGSGDEGTHTHPSTRKKRRKQKKAVHE